jgi:hypothetical protein
VVGCIVLNPVSQAKIVELIKLLYNDTTGVLATNWLTIAGNTLNWVGYFLSNGPKILELLGSEFVAADVTNLRLVAAQ